MAVLGDLGRACSSGARPGTAADSVDGVVPGAVVSPCSTEEVASALRAAAAAGSTVVARGAGTKLDWGNPPEAADLLVDLSSMGAVVEHTSGDLVARAEAGTTLAHLEAVLAEQGQCLPVDEVVPGSTVGGVVATGLSGPSRYLHGPVRDLVLGATAVRADGVVVHAGSKVVKNVAGYDLAKLFTGSYGTLVVLTEVTFKLRPRPAARRFVVASYERPEDLARTLPGVLASQAAPTAVELGRAGPEAPLQLCVLVEGRPRPVGQRVAEVAGAMGPCEVSPEPPPGWAELPGPVTFKLTSVLSALPTLVAQVSSLAREHGLAAKLAGSAGTGVLFLGVPGEGQGEGRTAPLAGFLAGVRRAAAAGGGHATVLRAPAPLKASLDVWGPVPGLELMRRVKDRFDPDRRLAPGRFVGGI
ncbi:MAG: FAD-binding oxidoreductase [Acidimicrobiales bacterium]